MLLIVKGNIGMTNAHHIKAFVVQYGDANSKVSSLGNIIVIYMIFIRINKGFEFKNY